MTTELERIVMPMTIPERAPKLGGWIRVVDEYPPEGVEFEILHFGGDKDAEIQDTASVDQWGICPEAKDGRHGKRSTVTHWRHNA